MSGKTDVSAINAGLKQKTDLLAFELTKREQGFDLKLTLGGKDGSSVMLLCGDVQNLELNPAGNGFDRMLDLEVADLRDDGLDRIHFSVEELKRETLFLHCGTIALQP